MKEYIRVSLIVPVYNGEKYLHRCLDSIINQSLTEIEIIIIDDGSTDNSARICQEYTRFDQRINYHKLEHNGVSNARNHALKLAQGEYLSFVDNDDYLAPDFCHNMYYNAKHNNSVICCCGINFVYDDRQGKSILPNPEASLLSQNAYIRGVVWNKLYKTELIQKLNIHFPQSSTYGEDFAFVLMTFLAYKNSYSVTYKNEVLYYYRRHKDSNMAMLKHNIYLSMRSLIYDFDSIQKFYTSNLLTNTQDFKRFGVNYHLVIQPLLLLFILVISGTRSESFWFNLRIFYYYQRKYSGFLGLKSCLIRITLLGMLYIVKMIAPLIRPFRSFIIPH